MPNAEQQKPKDIADEWGVTPAAVRRWLRDGKLAGVRTPGGSWRIPSSDKADDGVQPTTRSAAPEAA